MVIKKGANVMVERDDKWIHTIITGYFTRQGKRYYTVKAYGKGTGIPASDIRKRVVNF